MGRFSKGMVYAKSKSGGSVMMALESVITMLVKLAMLVLQILTIVTTKFLPMVAH